MLHACDNFYIYFRVGVGSWAGREKCLASKPNNQDITAYIFSQSSGTLSCTCLLSPIPSITNSLYKKFESPYDYFISLMPCKFGKPTVMNRRLGALFFLLLFTTAVTAAGEGLGTAYSDFSSFFSKHENGEIKGFSYDIFVNAPDRFRGVPAQWPRMPFCLRINTGSDDTGMPEKFNRIVKNVAGDGAMAKMLSTYDRKSF
ncbi:MAG: hypothetical protein HUN04_15345 [Desulfobacter sp.]|nr:MAG: hypothetical protein HUN04_15345 [Desulfobacter sp.]